MSLLVPSHVPLLAQLQNDNFEALGANSGLATESLPIVIARIIRAVLAVLGVLLVCLIVYAGYLYMVAGGDPAKTKKAKTIITNAIIGIILIFSSYSLASYVLNRLLAASGLGGGVTTTTATTYTEPLSGSLGSGIIESHYPARNAIDVPRNTRIMVTFKEAIDPTSLLKEADGAAYDGDPATPEYLNTDQVLIYPTDAVDVESGIDPADVALPSLGVRMTYSDDFTTFVFDPAELLGDGVEDVNYTVFLGSTILKTDGSAAFSGAYAEGYQWTFEVSTEVDLTPPYVVSAVPLASEDPYARNITIQITFNEAMDPVALSGTYEPDAGKTFDNVEVVVSDTNVEGTFAISNVYRTVEFTSNDACSKDPCGDTIYCLPPSAAIEVQAHAATLSEDAPQASVVGGLFDGVVDAAGNSLDGDGDGEAEGPGTPDFGGDDYAWEFDTSSEINDAVPHISLLRPEIGEEEVDVNAAVEITFSYDADEGESVLMQSSTLNSTNIQLVPDHAQELWFSLEQELLDSDSQTPDEGESAIYTKAVIQHAEFWESDEDAQTFYAYYPVITNGVKSAYQICMYPSYGPTTSDAFPLCATASQPYCCDGIPSDTACKTLGGTVLGQEE